MEVTAAVLAVAAGTVILSLYWYIRKRLDDAREPPSVGRFPLVGSLLHIRGQPLYLTLFQQFGTEPIVRVHLGMQCVYVLNRWSSFKAAMVDNAEQLSGRPSQKLAAKILGDIGGIVSSDGEVWRAYQRFTIRTLRDFGFGRRGAEDIIVAEAEHLRHSLDKAAGAPLENSALLSTAASNVICQIVFGSRLASEDAEFGEIFDLIRKIAQNSSSIESSAFLLSLVPITETVPFLATVLLKVPGTKEVIDDFLSMQSYCRFQIKKHAAEIEGVDKARDYIEAHLLHQRNRPAMFTDTRLAMAVGDLFIAGTDTTANTLRWAILFMIGNPDVAEKVHQEIVTHIGRERLPNMQDKAVMHFTQAVIEEIHRMACLIPLGVFHRITDDITVDGVKLKADSICLFNVYSIHHDPELFPEPNRFMPERHLTAGQFVPCPHLATFGLGRRACLGESLARVELFIFFITLMQRYTFSLDPEDSRTLWHLTEDPSFSKGTIIRSPPLHKVVVTVRS